MGPSLIVDESKHGTFHKLYSKVCEFVRKTAYIEFSKGKAQLTKSDKPHQETQNYGKKQDKNRSLASQKRSHPPQESKPYTKDPTTCNRNAEEVKTPAYLHHTTHGPSHPSLGWTQGTGSPRGEHSCTSCALTWGSHSWCPRGNKP